MCIVSFKERVKNEAIANAGLYEANFINFEYLICSEAFDDLYHIIKSDIRKNARGEWYAYFGCGR